MIISSEVLSRVNFEGTLFNPVQQRCQVSIEMNESESRDRTLILKGFIINNNHKPQDSQVPAMWRAVSTLHILNAD